MVKETSQSNSQAKLSARENRMEMANDGVKALLAINGAGAGAMLTLLQFTLQQNVGPKDSAITALLLFAVGMFLAALINFIRVESSLAFAGQKKSRRRWFWCHRALAIVSALLFLIGAIVVACGYRSA